MDYHILIRSDAISQLALSNAEAIASISGVNSLMLGPGDMRLALGLPSRRIDNNERDHPKFLAAIDQLISVSQRHRKPLMTVVFKVSAKEDTWVTKFNLLLATADFINVVKGHKADLDRTKKMVGDMLEAKNEKSQLNGMKNGNGH